MSNNFLTKKYISVNNKIKIKIKISHGPTNHNKININNKLKL